MEKQLLHVSPLVSIVIPLFNKHEYISETLTSVLNQTYTHIEVIVVNDGSTDGSVKVAESFWDPRLRIVHQENSGVEAARNFGFQLANGQFITFLDADDLIHPTKIEKQVDRFLSNQNLVLLGTFAKLIDTKNRFFGTIIPPATDMELRLEMMFANQFVCSSVMIRKVVLLSTEPFQTGHGNAFAEDLALWRTVSSLGSIENIPEFLTSYRKVANSRSRNSVSSPIESARCLAARYLYEETSLFNKIEDAVLLVKSIDGFNNLTVNTRNTDFDYLEKYSELVETLGFAIPQLEKRIHAHRRLIRLWMLWGYVPPKLQSVLYRTLFRFKNSKPCTYVRILTLKTIGGHREK